ncbi:hypothetical protein GCM10009559_55520 [Pseudonocardia zijingensis]|jgi:hypothetical protein|uniref:Uncharacterized protein n=1 Tax=Pseudonocardia zijingensis TaxID=153376 RepID=A0ABN1N7Z9_9PSEU
MQYAVWSRPFVKVPLDKRSPEEYQDSHTVCSRQAVELLGGDDEEMLPMTQTISGSAARNGSGDPPPFIDVRVIHQTTDK